MIMSGITGNFLRRWTSQRAIKNLSTLLSVGVAALLLLFLVTRFDMNIRDIWATLKASNPIYFMLAILIHYATFIFRGARWRVLLQNAQGHQTKVPGAISCGRLILLGWFVNSVTWFRLGDAYRAYVYADETKQSFPRTIGTVVAERVLDVTLVFLVLILGAFLLLLSGNSITWLLTVISIASGLAALLTGIIFGIRVFHLRLANRLPERLKGAYIHFHEGTMGSFRQVIMVSGLGLMGWFCEIGRLYLVTQAIGVDVSIGLVIFATVANAVLTLVPITPGGLGIVETGLVELLKKLSVGGIQAASIVILDRSISFVSVIITGGTVFVVRELTKQRKPNNHEDLSNKE
jgi:uncharacterized protein (TIRG00374 family)